MPGPVTLTSLRSFFSQLFGEVNTAYVHVAADPSPSNMIAGQVWYNTVQKAWKRWNGTAIIESPEITEGGIVTQITSAVTAVELDKLSGEITTFALANAAGVDHSFTLTNAKIGANDLIIAHTKTYGGTADGIPVVKVQSVAAGSCVLNVNNQGAVALDALAVISFAIIKGAIA